ncbi:MAG TPA: hypothetical protein PKZ36_00215 [Candidatus Paceibacterota bacterium]|nr:hypothetical protein [Candidatus Paceibacterota bacterium]HPT17828.1 hypothetical protein [Candidatus Paceibacterota bacterium]
MDKTRNERSPDGNAGKRNFEPKFRLKSPTFSEENDTGKRPFNGQEATELHQLGVNAKFFNPPKKPLNMQN